MVFSGFFASAGLLSFVTVVFSLLMRFCFRLLGAA
jgi:hypothetical protein